MCATVQGRYHTNGKKSIVGKFGADALGRKKKMERGSCYVTHVN